MPLAVLSFCLCTYMYIHVHNIHVHVHKCTHNNYAQTISPKLMNCVKKTYSLFLTQICIIMNKTNIASYMYIHAFLGSMLSALNGRKDTKD